MMDSSAASESFEELYEDAPCGYLSTRPEGMIIRVNRTFLSWTGYSAEELLLVRRFASLLTMPGALLYETHCMPLLRLRGSVGEIALDILGRNGKPLPVLLSAAVKKGTEGTPGGLRIVLMNAPTRREYERELVRARTQAEEATEQVRIHRQLAEQKVAEQQELLQAVGRMADGDLDRPVRVDIKSSQAQMAIGLEQMRKDIRAQILALKERNADVQRLNVELRHQIEERSRLLIESMESGMNHRPVTGMDYSVAEALPVFPAGTLLAGRYRIGTILGQGAMGTVYRVERISDDRPFAAKILSVKPDFQAMARFAREAQLLARLQHPNLISIVDVDITEERVAYIVMELAQGESLAELTSRYRCREFILPVLLQIADALSMVHSAGVVHRDLKPAKTTAIENRSEFVREPSKSLRTKLRRTPFQERLDSRSPAPISQNPRVGLRLRPTRLQVFSRPGCSGVSPSCGDTLWRSHGLAGCPPSGSAT